MRKILDKMFQNKKISFFVPLLSAALGYLLFLFFGSAEDKTHLLIAAPIATVFWLLGVFLVAYIQVKNTSCPVWFLKIFEFLAVVFFFGFSVIETILFLTSGLQSFNIGVCVGFVTYSAISLAHSKRTK